MSDLERRGGSHLNRQQRVDRAYKLVVASGALGLVGAAGILLSIVGIGSAFLSVLALIIAAILFMAFKRSVR
jgi:hypothetical protein